MTPSKAVVVPVKELSAAKSRLSAVLNSKARKEAALALAKHVICIARQAIDLVIVVTPDQEVAEVARSLGAYASIEPPELALADRRSDRLNLALLQGCERAEALGAREVLILAADLPLLEVADVIAAFIRPGIHGISLSPSADGSGTNALALPLPPPIDLSFGPNSAQAHAEQSLTQGIALRVIRRPGIAFDLDTPEDLQRYRGLSAKTLGELHVTGDGG
jgi:2-phospho-L-lactate guanylyltransferase